MATNNPLLVPLAIEAFVANDAVLQNKGVNIQRWTFGYNFLKSFNSPEPKPFTGSNNLPGTGVLLQWTLPEVLRTGEQGLGGALDLPLVPNRWLVVRYSGPLDARTAVGWVVQSDALGNSDPVTGGAAYLEPGAPSIQTTTVGQVVALENWSEPDPPSLFLTAVAPGNPMFASFQPYSWNCLSMYDPLDGVADRDILSYLVVGWYSEQSADVIGRWQTDGGTFEQFLAQAEWTLAAPSDDVSTWGLYHGMAWGIDWDLNGSAPSTMPDSSNVQLALGETTVDALSALIAHQSADQPDVDPGLLEAFQHGLLPAYDQPDADFEVAQQIHEGAFAAATGGFRWTIANTPVDPADGNPASLPSVADLQAEQQWLTALNQDQQTFEAELAKLLDMQWQLYQTWWKQQNIETNGLTDPWPDGTSQAQFNQALDDSDPSSLISRVHAQQQTVAQAKAAVPTGATQDELQQAIDAYAAANELPPTRRLKQTTAMPAHWAIDPVVLLQGAGSDPSLTPRLPRFCRFMDQVVTGFFYDSSEISAASLQGTIPVPVGMASVPAQIPSLLDEFFLLDPTNAAMVAASALDSTDPLVIAAVAVAMTGGDNVVGTVPDIDLAIWAQPWRPLVLLWDIVFYPIPHDNGVGADPLWTFDGVGYRWNGEGFDDNAPSWEYMGMLWMSPQASTNFQAQLRNFIRNNPDTDKAQALEAFIETIDDWDFLSQGLAGLTQQMALRDPDPNVGPTADATSFFGGTSLAQLTGNSTLRVPMPGPTQPPPFESWGPSGFQNWRAGQFYIQRLYVVDRFGQTLDVVDTTTQLYTQPILGPALIPQVSVLSSEPSRFVQLQPRLLQSARLDLDFVSCADDNNVLGLEPLVNPVCAWLLHNLLDQSLVCYDNRGNILGSTLLTTDDQQQQQVTWEPAPNSLFLTIADLIAAPDLNHLGSMLDAMQTLGADAFKSMLETIDLASWTIEPPTTSGDATLVLLAGRPVAMVRVRVQPNLDGTSVSDPSWRFTFAPEANPVTGWNFNIRLGEAGHRADGLVGYFLGADYNTCYAPQVPPGVPDPGYVTAVGTGASLSLPFDGSTAAYLSLLMDPRSQVHATTGILPTRRLHLPQEFVDGAFAAMDLTFQIGPLAAYRVHPGAAEPNADPVLIMPRPSTTAGSWTWQQYDGSAWIDSGLKPSSESADLFSIPAVLREGLLRLTGAITEETSE